MKMSEALTMLDLNKYQELLDVLVGRTLGLALLSEGRLVKVSMRCDEILSDTDVPLEKSVVQFVWLQDYQYQPFAKLLLVSDQALSTENQSSEALNAIARCVQDELVAAAEMIEMTDEVAARYEELNLVFSNQHLEKSSSGISRQLKDIVDSSNQYMKMGFCFMGLGSQGLTFLSVDDEELRFLEEGMSSLLKPVIKLLEENPGSHVFNDGLEYALPVSHRFKKWRHVVTPITIGSSDNIAGFMLVARPPENPFFTNSDKNLLEVMAQKASKLIRSTYDDLTHLLRRDSFQSQLDLWLEESPDKKNELSLLKINVDRMQVINEACSYEAGNELFKWIARNLQQFSQPNEIVGRLGGNRFGILLRRKTDDQAERAARRVIGLFQRKKFHWRGEVVEITVSGGLTVFGKETISAAQALSEAEFACSAAKEYGGGRLEKFASGDKYLRERQAQINQVNVIQSALREDLFVLYAQPIQPLVDTSREPHAEILIRMKAEDGKIVLPGHFLPAAEEFDLMPSIDRWVIEQALEAIGRNTAAINSARLVLTINLSGQALSDSGFVQFLKECLDRFKPRPGSICFEVTETTAIRDMNLAQILMSDLRSRGVSFALDDFGTGLSSFSYLQKLPLDMLKIDGSFVREIIHDDVAHTMVKAINDVGQSMGLTTVAEFVSSSEIAAALVEIGVDYGQGFSLAEPMPLDDFLTSLSTSPQSKTA